MAYQRNPIKNAPSVPYHGETMEPINRMHWQQQIHKYNLGLFVTGIAAMTTALLTLIGLIACTILSNGATEEALKANDLYKSFHSLSTTCTILFVIALGIDVIFTVLLNKYYKNKLPLILFIPALVIMLIFCVPELCSLLTLFGIKIDWAGVKTQWSDYIVIVVCSAFIILELLRMIIHRDDLNIYAEVKKALK